MKKSIRLTENELHAFIKEAVTSVLLESRGIKSKKLYDIMQQHGGIKSNHGVFDIHNLTDDDIIGVVDYRELRHILDSGTKKYAKEKGINLGIADDLDSIELNDRMYILAKLRGANFDRIRKSVNAEREKTPGDFELLHNKTEQRHRNRYPRKDEYVWNNDDASDLFHNPYFRNGNEHWTPQRKREVVNNVKNGRRWFENK
jgi:hypothetical protein